MLPVHKCWCSCGGDENNLSTGIDNAEITSRPSRVSPVEMVLKTVQLKMILKFNGTFIAFSSTAIHENPKQNKAYDLQTPSFYEERENL
ncbi:hypothetical protein TURU_109793 [Turdus rufiventris]|nr:hypothetical protein TURU_109793 [Turdus rufiventris]